MDKKIQQSMLFLIVLIVVSVATGIIVYLQKQAVEKQVATLAGQVSEFEAKETKMREKVKTTQEEADKLRKELEARDAEREGLMKKADDARKELDRVAKSLKDTEADFQRMKNERSSFDAKLADLQRQRDDLTREVLELKNRPPKETIVYRDRPAEPVAATAEAVPAVNPAPAAPQPLSPAAAELANVSRDNEDYWAGVIRKKAEIELELQKTKADLDAANIQVADIKKANSDLEMELGRLKNDKNAIERKIKYGEDLADSISVELARARNEQKLTQDRSDELLAENQKLRLDIKQLTTTKVALERSIANLSEEKRSTEKKLVETENIIQGRIDEIWQIKKDIDSRIAARPDSTQGEVELAPIVVSAKKNAPAATEVSVPARTAKKVQGSVVSVNEQNNFVIVDLGEKSGVKVGDQLKVYHNGVQAGVVAIIQVRAEISAADIKVKLAPISVGDTVR